MSPIRIIVRVPKPECFLRYRISAATRNFTSVKSDVYVLIAAARRGFKMVLFTASRWNNFVGGTCALPSALLVHNSTNIKKYNVHRAKLTYLADAMAKAGVVFNMSVCGCVNKRRKWFGDMPCSGDHRMYCCKYFGRCLY